MNDLEKWFNSNVGRKTIKDAHYLSIYDMYFNRYRNTDVSIVEFGVAWGGSMQMWKRYFGPNAKIYGVDINPKCKEVEEDQITIFICDQDDRDALQSLASAIPKIDILIDDGGHFMHQQINTFEVFFPKVAFDGIYAVEDLFSSYWPSFNGGYKKEGSFIEYSKNFIDYINAWFLSDQDHQIYEDKINNIADFTKSTAALHYYPDMLIIEKGIMDKPSIIWSGKIEFEK